MYFLKSALKVLRFIIITGGVLLTSCNNKDDDKIEFIFLQLNDVYEMGALGGGEYGGLDRVETLHKQLLKENPNTFMFMAGDFLNPSLLGNIKFKGKRIKGKQMIEVMNAMGFDLVTFGNHEFDLNETQLQHRIDSSRFVWLATNIRHKTKEGILPFYKTDKTGKKPLPNTIKYKIKDADGTEIKIAFFSATINSNPVPYVKYEDFYEYSKNFYGSLKDSVDVVFALTHLKISQDKMLAEMLPEIPLFMGGHEHYHIYEQVGDVRITKADANAKTVYVHRITYDKNTGKTEIKSSLVNIDKTIPSDPKIAALIDKWQQILDKQVTKTSKHAKDVIFEANEPLIGLDDAVRSEQTNLGQMIAEAMAYAYDYKVDGALVNGGSMRLDDNLQGEITGVDIFRVLPFGGSILKVKIKGKLLKRVLNYGRISKGQGAYLQRYNFKYLKDKKQWLVGGTPIRDDKIYTVAFTDFLLKGYDISFLKPSNKGVIFVFTPDQNDLAGDIRRAVIRFLKESDTKK